MKYHKHLQFVLIIGFIIIFAGFGCERKDIIVDPPDGGNYQWVEEYTALSPLIFPHDSLLIVDSVYFPGKIANIESVNDEDQIQMKSILHFYMTGTGFQIDIFRDDTILVNQYKGRYSIISDTFRFNIGDSIIQDYGYEFINSDLIRFYDFKWPDSNGITYMNIPHDYILWWGYALKTEGVFTRKEIKE